MDDETVRYGALIGSVSAVYLSVRYWQSSDLELFRTVFSAGVLTGLLFGRKGIEVRRAGFIVGLVGSLSVVWVVSDMIVFISDLNYSVWSDSVQMVAVAIFTGVIVTLAAVTGLVGALFGDWLNEKAGRYYSLAATTDS